MMTMLRKMLQQYLFKQSWQVLSLEKSSFIYKARYLGVSSAQTTGERWNPHLSSKTLFFALAA